MKTGDVIATVARPIAKGIDWIFETDVQNCGGCNKRRDWLNNFGDKFYDYFFDQQKGEITMGKPFTMTIELALEDADSPVDAAAKWKEGVPISITNVRPRPQAPITQGRPENFAGITPDHLQNKGR